MATNNQFLSAVCKNTALVAVGCFLWQVGSPVFAEQKFSELVDAHIHYSHDAWEHTPPEKAVSLLKKAGLKKAFVSSSSDQGTKAICFGSETYCSVIAPLSETRRVGFMDVRRNCAWNAQRFA